MITAWEIVGKAVVKYGPENQTRKAVEELTELSLALQRALDGRADMANICEEIADVEIMCEQLRRIYDPSGTVVNTVQMVKLHRLEKIISS